MHSIKQLLSSNSLIKEQRENNLRVCIHLGKVLNPTATVEWGKVGLKPVWAFVETTFNIH